MNSTWILMGYCGVLSLLRGAENFLVQSLHCILVVYVRLADYHHHIGHENILRSIQLPNFRRIGWRYIATDALVDLGPTGAGQTHVDAASRGGTTTSYSGVAC